MAQDGTNLFVLGATAVEAAEAFDELLENSTVLTIASSFTYK